MNTKKGDVTMNVILAFTQFSLVILIYWVISEFFTVLFRFTGVPDEKARFQVVSLLTGSGYTTRESELFVSTKSRRRLARIIMLFGYVFNITFISALINVFLTLKASERTAHHIIGMMFPVIAIAIIFLFIRIPKIHSWGENLLEMLVGKIMKRGNENSAFLLGVFFGSVEHIDDLLRLERDVNRHLAILHRQNALIIVEIIHMEHCMICYEVHHISSIRQTCCFCWVFPSAAAGSAAAGQGENREHQGYDQRGQNSISVHFLLLSDTQGSTDGENQSSRISTSCYLFPLSLSLLSIFLTDGCLFDYSASMVNIDVFNSFDSSQTFDLAGNIVSTESFTDIYCFISAFNFELAAIDESIVP